jgi:HEXXH motif-containing protein
VASDADRLRAEPPGDLTLPEVGSPTARRVFSAWLAELLASVGRLPLARASAPVRADATRVLRAARTVLATDPGAVLGALRRTTVSAHFRTALDARGDVDTLLAAGCANLAAELAASGAPFDAFEMERPPRRILVRGARTAIDAPARVTFAPGRVAVRGRDVAPAGGPWIEIDRDVVLALEDDNPLAAEEAHPDKEGNALSLGGRPPEEWVASLRDALARIERYLPALRAEMDLGLMQIVPVGFEPEKHLSASYREAVGTIYATLHPDALTMTEALVHEFQHTKLNALLSVDPLLENAFSPLYTSPVRPDPRPLHGVLLAVHAFVPNAILYQRMRDAGDPLSERPRFAERHAEIERGNRQGLDVLLEHGRATPIGRALLEELARLAP